MYEEAEKIDLKEGDIALVIGDDISVYLRGFNDDDPPTNGLMFIAGVMGRMKTDKAFVEEQIEWARDKIMEREGARD